MKAITVQNSKVKVSSWNNEEVCQRRESSSPWALNSKLPLTLCKPKTNLLKKIFLMISWVMDSGGLDYLVVSHMSGHCSQIMQPSEGSAGLPMHEGLSTWQAAETGWGWELGWAGPGGLSSMALGKGRLLPRRPASPSASIPRGEPRRQGLPGLALEVTPQSCYILYWSKQFTSPSQFKGREGDACPWQNYVNECCVKF